MLKRLAAALLLSAIVQNVAFAAGDNLVANTLGTVYNQIKINKTTSPDDYDSSETFANFREIVATGLKEKTLYRTSNPLDIHGNKVRHSYADKLAQKYAIKTEIDLTDDDNDILLKIKSNPVKKKYCYKEIYLKGNLFNTYLGGDGLYSQDWPKIAAAFRFMLEHEGPYMVHCTLGRDRAGLFSMLSAALAGATVNDLRRDYMLTFCNYYHIKPNTYDYSIIQLFKCDKVLYYIAHPECAEDKNGLPERVNVNAIVPEKAAINFFKTALKFSDDEIVLLQNKLKASKVS